MQHKNFTEALSRDGEGDIKRGKHSGQYVDDAGALKVVDQRTTKWYLKKIN